MRRLPVGDVVLVSRQAAVRSWLNSSTAGDQEPEVRLKRVLQLISEDPGCNMGDVGQSAGLRYDALRPLLAALAEDGHVFLGGVGPRVHLFPNLEGISSCWPQVVALRDDSGSLHQLLLEQGEAHHQA